MLGWKNTSLALNTMQTNVRYYSTKGMQGQIRWIQPLMERQGPFALGWVTIFSLQPHLHRHHLALGGISSASGHVMRRSGELSWHTLPRGMSFQVSAVVVDGEMNVYCGTLITALVEPWLVVVGRTCKTYKQGQR